MKIELKIYDYIFKSLVDECKRRGITVTVKELKANPKIQKWFQSDIETIYFQFFEDGLGDSFDPDDLGLVAEDEDEE